MKTEQKKWTKNDEWEFLSNSNLKDKAQLVLLFGDTALLKEEKYFKQVKDFYPKATIISCSTAGEIIGTKVLDDSLVSTAIFGRYQDGIC